MNGSADRKASRRGLGILAACAAIVTTISCGSTDTVAPEQAPSSPATAVVGLYADAGADPYLRAMARHMFTWMGYGTVDIRAADVNAGDFKGIRLLYMPGGSTPPFRRDISEEGREHLRSYIAGGCGYMGTCAGALIACSGNLWGGRQDDYGLFALLPVTGIGPIPELEEGRELPLGRGYVMAELIIDGGHPVTSGYEGTASILSLNSPWFEAGSGISVLARYARTGGAAVVAGEFGAGRVVLTGPHPEVEEDSPRDGNSYFDVFEDQGSDWPLMSSAAAWCLGGGAAFDPPTVAMAGLAWMQYNYHPSMNPSDDGSMGTPYGGRPAEGKGPSPATAPHGDYGWLYTWEEARALCPPGWRLPTRADWEALFAACGGEGSAGAILKAPGRWSLPGGESLASLPAADKEAGNSGDFLALPAGGASDKLRFDGLGWAAHFWSAGSRGTDSARVEAPGLMYDGDAVNWLDLPPTMYASVRYVRDIEP